MGKKSTAGDEVLRAVEFEKEKLTWLQRTKLATSGRLPEIDLINIWKLIEERRKQPTISFKELRARLKKHKR